MPTLWPFQPSEDFVESIAWRTDVIRPYATEQRIRLTDIPRRIFNLTSWLNHQQYERAKLIAESVGGGAYYLPLWHERQRFTASGGATSITVTTTNCEYSTDGYACLWADDETCEVIAVSTVGGSSLGLESATSYTYTNALIMPCVVAYNRHGFDVSRDVNPIVSISGEWSVYSGTDIGASSYPTYRTYPAFDDPVTIGAGSVSERFGFEIDEVDNGLAVPFLDDVRATIDRTLSLGWMTSTLADLRTLRAFLHYIKGKQKAFWVPDWTNGLILAADIAPADTTITVESVGLNVTGETGDLCIRDASGNHTRLQYTAVNVSGANEVLTLSGAAGITLDKDDGKVCRMRLCRLAQDRVEMAHVNIGSDATLTSVQALCDEVPFA